MTQDDREEAPARARKDAGSGKTPGGGHSITPDDAPSALERGARIFERLARRNAPRRKEPD